MLPSLPSTKIWSASLMLANRCATTIVVRPLLTSFIESKIAFSVVESSELVHSSQRRIGGSFRMVRAMATRCFSPPESLRPRSPT
mmetsp:Transcript_19691/g.49987  ORF Transcript_19691/g.49987 Transcript_19691/m.49987 type:complete len:85 (-) Transcript_19691:1885-2139(-)